MSIKVKQALTKCLTQIKNQTFDEDTIRTLLIVARDFIKEEGLVKELAHFIAHPVRDKGIFHKRVNNRYAKWKLVDEQFDKVKDNKDFFKTIETESQLSDFMLGAVQLESIDAKLFEILYVDGINDISEKHLLTYTGMGKTKAIELLKSSYEKKNNQYILRAIEIEEGIRRREKMVKTFGLEILGEAERKKVIEIIQKDLEIKGKIDLAKKQIDHLQKVIRGTIEFPSVFEENTLDKEIYSSISKLITQFNLDSTFLMATKKFRKDILLCIMTLLHDSTFKFYDGNQARTFLCFYREQTEEDFGKLDDINTIYAKGVLGLYITYKVFDKTNSHPLFISDLKIKDYINKSELDEKTDYLFNEIPWTTAIRQGKKLKLVKSD